MIKEILWLDDDDEDQVVVEKVSAYAEGVERIRQYAGDMGQERHLLEVHILPQTFRLPDMQLWAISDDGSLIEYYLVKWYHPSWDTHWHVILGRHHAPQPVPKVVLRYVEAWKASQQEKDTPC